MLLPSKLHLPLVWVLLSLLSTPIPSNALRPEYHLVPLSTLSLILLCCPSLRPSVLLIYLLTSHSNLLLFTILSSTSPLSSLKSNNH